MSKITHVDVEMHGVRTVHNNPEYLPYAGYFKWTKRSYYFYGIKIWSCKLNWRECDVYELARM